ncbi:uncharacterized protein VTP21DRAFT_11539 [Calcarisporiella thermophila]|uniref:uncharacterized protein n=1 Tax=Calcarisporiella thermophila TaxID=911321 RepID=UPI003743DF8B
MDEAVQRFKAIELAPKAPLDLFGHSPLRPIFDQLLLKLVEIGELERARTLFREVEWKYMDSNVNISKFHDYLNPSEIYAYGRALIHAEEWEVALELLTQRPMFHGTYLSKLITEYLGKERAEDVSTILDAQLTKDLRKPSSVFIQSVLYGYCRIGKVEIAANALDRMKQCGGKAKPYHHHTIIVGYLQKERPDLALAHLRGLKGGETAEINSGMPGVILRSLGADINPVDTNERLRLVRETLEFMAESGLELGEEDNPSIRRALLRGKDKCSVVKWINELPAVPGLNRPWLLAHLLSTAMIQQKPLAEIQSLVDVIPSEAEDGVGYFVASFLISRKMQGLVRPLFEELTRSSAASASPKTHALLAHLQIEVHLQQQEYEEAWAHYGQFREFGLLGRSYSVVHRLLVYLAREKKLDRVTQMWWDLRAAEVAPDKAAFCFMMDANIEDAALVEQLGAEMRERQLELDSDVISRLVRTHALQPQVDQEALEKHLQEYVRLIDGEHTSGTIRLLMLAYNRAGKMDKVRELWELVRRQPELAHGATASILLDACGFWSTAQEVKRVWGQLRKEYPALIGVNVANSYVESLCRHGCFDDAVRVVTVEMRELGIDPESKTIGTLVPFLNRAGRFDSLRKIRNYLYKSYPELLKGKEAWRTWLP